MAIQDWSTEEINLAKQHFLNGLAIKDIAKQLGRTPSSTNKALTRFGIRAKKPKSSNKNSSKSGIKAPGFDKKSLHDQFDNWVSFWKVCDFLSTQRVCILEQSKHDTLLEQRMFLVGHKSYSARQLLLMANKIRAENNLQPFFVEGLSW